MKTSKNYFSLVKKSNFIPVEFLKKYYYVEAGVLRVKTSRNKNKPVGSAVGTLHHSGYLYTRILYKKQHINQSVHRVIFALIKGYWPTGLLDHIDRNKLNNKIENLRESDQSLNCINTKLKSTNVTGYRNISVEEPYGPRVVIARKGNVISKRFKTMEEAIEYRDKKLAELDGFLYKKAQ
jgi:hypothetical protein